MADLYLFVAGVAFKPSSDQAFFEAPMQRISTIPFLLAIPAILSAAASSVTVTSSANPAVLGHPTTLTAVVTPSAATGSVIFYEGTAVLETEPVVSGRATFTTTLLPSGTASLKAYYSGDGNYSASASTPLPQTVNAVLERNFEPPVNYFTGGNANTLAVAVGDFNGDGKADLAVANEYSNVSILLGNGDGSFEPTVLSVEATTVAVGDFNGDGKADLAISNDYLVSILLGNGDGTFQPPIGYGAPSSPATSLVVGDFNGDGRADIAAEVEGSAGGILLGNGDGTFRPPAMALPYVPVPNELVSGDFNGDGNADLATVSDYGGIYVFLGNGDGTFEPAVTYPLPDGASDTISLVCADFNGDGKLDLAAASNTGDQGQSVTVLLGNGDGTFQAGVNYYPPVYLEWLSVGDFNGDGKADLAVTGGQLYVLFGNGDGTFPSGANFGGNYGSAVVGDFNGDGRTDLAAMILGGVGSLLGTLQGPTTISLQSSLNPSRYSESVTLSATVSPASATGTVSFYNGSSLLGTGDLRDGVATFTLSSLPTGVHSLTAVYNADVNDATSKSPILKQIVGKTATSTTLFSNPNPSTVGQAVVFQARITPSSATGTVSFYHGSEILGTAKLNGGKANLFVSKFPAGEHAITAVYGGDQDDATSTSLILTQVVE